MITEIKAVCPRSGETAMFVRHEDLQGYVCSCSECGSRDRCRSFIADEDLANNPDGDNQVRRCHCDMMRRFEGVEVHTAVLDEDGLKSFLEELFGIGGES